MADQAFSGENDGLHFSAIGTFAACDDHVFQTLQYVNITGFVLVADVSGAKESVSERSLRVGLVVPESAHCVRATRYQPVR